MNRTSARLTRSPRGAYNLIKPSSIPTLSVSRQQNGRGVTDTCRDIHSRAVTHTHTHSQTRTCTYLHREGGRSLILTDETTHRYRKQRDSILKPVGNQNSELSTAPCMHAHAETDTHTRTHTNTHRHVHKHPRWMTNFVHIFLE